MPEVVLSALQILTHLFLTIAVWNHYYHSHILDKKLSREVKQLFQSHVASKYSQLNTEKYYTIVSVVND